MKNAQELMQEKYLSFSVVERKISDYILQNPGRAIYMTTALLAREAGVSEGSIINFSNKLGFNGFRALKLNLAQHLPHQEKMIAAESTAEDTPQAVMKTLAKEIGEAFRMTISSLQNQDLKKAASLISGKKRIEIYGIGSSSMVASDAYYRFMRQKLPAYAVTDAHIASVSASTLDADCVVIAISHSGRSVETIHAAELAKQHGAAIISLTSYYSSPLAQLGDVVLVSATKEAAVFREAEVSRYSQLLILDGLLRYISLKNLNQAVENIENVTEIIGEHRM